MGIALLQCAWKPALIREFDGGFLGRLWKPVLTLKKAMLFHKMTLKFFYIIQSVSFNFYFCFDLLEHKLDRHVIIESCKVLFEQYHWLSVTVITLLALIWVLLSYFKSLFLFQSIDIKLMPALCVIPLLDFLVWSEKKQRCIDNER